MASDAGEQKGPDRVGKRAASSFEVSGSGPKCQGSLNFEAAHHPPPVARLGPSLRQRSPTSRRHARRWRMVRRGGPGPKCSPRSSANPEVLCSRCACHATSTFVDGIFASCDKADEDIIASARAAAATCAAVQSFFGRLFQAPPIRRLLLLLACTIVGIMLLLVLLAVGVRCLYGGEADEAIRFMEPEHVQEPMQEPAPTTSTNREHQMEVLKAIDGVSAAKYFGIEGHRTKQFGASLYVHPGPEAERQFIRVACASDKPLLVDAARAAKRRVAAILGEPAVEAAERLVAERHTAAGPSAGVERNVNAMLGETQRLQALKIAAQTRAIKAEVAAERAEAEAAEAAAAITRGPEAARKEAWLELEAAQAALDAHTKRQRVEAGEAAPAAKEPKWRSRPYAKYDTVQKWVDREGELWNRRQVKLSPAKPARPVEKLKPRGPNGNDGPLNHWRRSVVGAVQDWAEGSSADAAKIIFWVIEELGLEEEMCPLLHGKTSRDMETALYVAERVRDGLRVLKPCSTEGQRRELLSGLALAAPPRVAERGRSGMLRRVSDFLGFRRGRRSKKQSRRPFIFDRAVTLRSEFDAAAIRQLGPLGHVFAEGVRVLTHNGPAEIARLTADGGVVVTYRNGDSYAERTYISRFGKAKGSARLQHMPPSLLPPPRETRR